MLDAKIRPMLAGTSAPFDSKDHLFEIKWDGIRAIAFFGDGVARLQGRKLSDASDRYPEVVAGLSKLPGNGVLDGEIVVLEDDGRPSFQRVLVREQTHSRDAALLKAREHPAVYIAFDLLFLNGEPLLDKPLIERKHMLTELLVDAPSPIVESSYVVASGKALFDQAAQRGLEGVMAKRLDSRYTPGERSNDWLKLKVRRTTEGVLMGLVRERGSRRVKSLVLGAYRHGRLVWLGNVGSGLDQTTLGQLATEMGPLKGEKPSGFEVEAPGDIDWLTPRLVVRVAYSELTKDRRLRHPVFVGFVERRPQDCSAPST